MENTKRSIFPFYLVFLFFLGVFFIPLHSVEEKTQEISFQDYKIHNRILAKVEGKPISVIDVMKQMNVYIAEFFPELLQSPEQRYQFYMAHWKTTLQKMIATELIMADAKSRNFKVADGDVREGIQRKFGPNVIQKLDQLGISYEEAKAIVYQENIRKTMEWFRVISKAVHRVGIKEIQQEYKKVTNHAFKRGDDVYELIKDLEVNHRIIILAPNTLLVNIIYVALKSRGIPVVKSTDLFDQGHYQVCVCELSKSLPKLDVTMIICISTNPVWLQFYHSNTPVKMIYYI